MFKETESDFSLQDIKDVIFQEEGNNDMVKIVMMFDRDREGSELSTILAQATDACTYFLNTSIGDKSPSLN